MKYCVLITRYADTPIVCGPYTDPVVAVDACEKIRKDYADVIYPVGVQVCPMVTAYNV